MGSGHRKEARREMLLGIVFALAFVGLTPELVVAEDESSGCDNGWACIFENRDWNHPDGVGRVLQFRDCNISGDSNCDWQILDLYNFNDELSSWRNKKTDDAKWDYHFDGSGPDRCMESETRRAYVGDTDNDEASAIKVFNRDDVCF